MIYLLDSPNPNNRCRSTFPTVLVDLPAERVLVSVSVVFFAVREKVVRRCIILVPLDEGVVALAAVLVSGTLKGRESQNRNKLGLDYADKQI